MPVGVGQACLGQPVHSGGLDESSEWLHRGKAHVIPHDVEHIGRALRRLWLLVRLPVGRRVADIQVDNALKWFGHGTISLCVKSAVELRRSDPEYEKSGLFMMHEETRQEQLNLPHTYHAASPRSLRLQNSYIYNLEYTDGSMKTHHLNML